MKLSVRQAEPGAAPSIASKSLVGFVVGGVRYAIDIHKVREIIRPMPLLVLPKVPDMVSGVVDHRGDVVPVVDLRVRLGVRSEGPMAESARRERALRWVIVARGRRLVALVVDSVSEVFSAADPTSREVPEIGVGEEARGIIAAYSHRGELVFVVDPDVLTSITETLTLPPSHELGVGDGVA